MRWMMALALTFATPAVAQDDAPEPPLAVSSARDVVKAVDAKKSDDEILAAIKASDREWRPKDVFELLDKKVPEAVSKGLATHLGLYWDDSYRALDELAAEARKYQDAKTLKLNDGNLIVLFEWFNDIKYEREAAEKGVGSLPPKAAGELDSAYDLRKRQHQIAKVKALGLPDGKVDALTVELELTAQWEPYDARTGCGRAVLRKVVNEVDFFVFRETLGNLTTESPVDLKSRSIESMRFASDGDRRIEAYSHKMCTSESGYASSAGRPVKLEATLNRTWDGKWSGRGEFTSGGNRIPANR